MKKFLGYFMWAGFLASFMSLSGCATAPKRTAYVEPQQPSQSSMYQSQISQKDAQISQLQEELNAQKAASAQAEAEKQAMNQRLSDLESKMSQATTPSKPKYDSDLK